MPVGLIGRKVGMTQVYGENGVMIPVTIVEAGPCPVLQLRTKERDGYDAVQLGFGVKPRRLAIRAERGHVAKLGSKRSKSLEAAGKTVPAKAGCEPQRHIREFRLDGETADLEVGKVLDVSLFAETKAVDIIGTTKGRGFTGAMKRWNFQGQNASHGEKKVHRRVGSIGNRSWPGRVFPGLKMAGHYGTERVTIRNLTVVRVDKDNNLLVIKGAIPGPNGGVVLIRPTNYVK